MMRLMTQAQYLKNEIAALCELKKTCEDSIRVETHKMNIIKDLIRQEQKVLNRFNKDAIKRGFEL